MNAYDFSLFLILLDFITFFHDTDHNKSNLSANIQINYFLCCQTYLSIIIQK